MTNVEAADILKNWQAFVLTGPDAPEFDEAIQLAITALEHQPEPQTAEQFDQSLRQIRREMYQKHTQAMACNVCHWRTLDTHKLLCDNCGSYEMNPVEVSNVRQAKD